MKRNEMRRGEHKQASKQARTHTHVLSYLYVCDTEIQNIIRE